MPEDDFELLDDNTDLNLDSGNISPNTNKDNIVSFNKKTNKTTNDSSKNKKINTKRNNIPSANPINDMDEKRKEKQKKRDDVFNNELNENYDNRPNSRLKKAKNKLEDRGKDKDTAEKSLENAKGKRRQINSGLGNKKDDDSENKKVDDKKDSNDSKDKKELNPIKNVKNKLTNRLESAKEIAANPEKAIKAVAKKVTKASVKLVMSLLSPLIMGLLLVIFVVYLILGPLMEVWQAIDQGTTVVANSIEKFTNFYTGFGFQDSKQAFFDQVNELNEFYDDQLNLPLIMSTIFYTEQEGYNTDYEQAEEMDSSDPLSTNLDGGVTGLLSFFRTWVEDKLEEASSTTDANGLTYNAGKIYRLRRLARAQCTRSGPEKEVSLGEFIDIYGSLLGKTIKNFFQQLIGTILTTALKICRMALEILTLNFDAVEQTYSSITDGWKAVGDCFQMILDVVTFGLCDAKLSWELFGSDGLVTFTVKYKPYKFDGDKYDDYLRDYYIKNTPEFKRYLTEDEKFNNRKIDQIIRNIHLNEKAFRQIVLQEIHGSSETYADGCVGAIDSNIISNLHVPVDIKNTSAMYFDSNSAFGVVNGLKHNGVDLNSSNAQVDAGSNVYAIANGKVESVGLSNDSISSSNLDNYLFIGDSRYASISSKLKKYGNNVTVFGVVSSSPSQWIETTKNGSGTVLDTSVTLPSSVSNISIMLGVNDLSQDDELKTVINNLHNRYPNAIIYVNSVFHIGKSYGGYANDNLIDEFNKKMSTFCDGSSWAQYIDISNNLYESSGYLNASYTPDGLHLNGVGQDILVGNIVSLVTNSVNTEEGGATIKLSHELLINGKNYKFYSVYANLDTSSVNLKTDDTVSKGDIIGKIGKTNAGVSQLHFEFRNESDTPIDPTNLFIACTNNSITLVGDTNEAKISNALLSAGFNYVQVASVMANISYESGYDPTSINSLGCTGISQWCFERQENLTNYAKSKKSQNTDLQTQITFLIAELKNEGEAVPYADTNGINISVYKDVMDSIRDYKDVNLATEYYCNNFEIPGEDLCATRRNGGKGLEWYRILTNN